MISHRAKLICNIRIRTGISLSACILAAALPLAASATKLNAKPLPRSSNFVRPDKEFNSADTSNPDDAMPPSLWNGRKQDYRDEARHKKEDDEKKAAEQKKAAEKQKQDQINAVRQYQQTSIDANNQGVALGKQGRWNEAIAAHELALKYDPSNKQFAINLSAARCAYGQQRLARGDASGAAHLFRQSIEAVRDNSLASKCLSDAIKKMGLDPGIADNRIGLGDQLAATGDLAGATIEYQAAMVLDPNARTYTKMGDISARYGQLQNAVNWYRQAIVKDSDYGPAHRQLGLILLMAKDNPGAASELRKAVIIDKSDGAAGQALVELWRKQVAASPTLAECHLGLAGALQLTDDMNGAEAEYQKVEQLDPRNPALAAAKASLQRSYRHQEAEKHRQAAETFANQGLKREALGEMNQAVMMEPKNDRYQFQYARFLEALGDYKNALEGYKNCVLINPKGNDEAAERMRELKQRMESGQVPNQAQQIQQQKSQPQSLDRNQIYQEQVQYAQQQGQQQGQQSGPQTSQQAGQQAAPQPRQASQAVPKNLYEQAPAAIRNEAPPYTGGFRTHEDARAPLGTPAAPLKESPQVTSTLNQALDLEMKRDFAGAINLLKEALSNNLQNPEIHHRLGLNLVNVAQLPEAISELRIASALDPGNKTFAEDLARVLNIHKRSMTTEGDAAGQGAPR